MSKSSRVPPALVAGVAVGAAVAAGVAALGLTGIGIRRPVSHPDPAHSVDDAWQRVEALRSAEEGAIHPAGHTTLLAPVDPAPGTPTVVLMHGLTMTPDQFGWVGGVIRDAGYRVLLPRMPDHGRTDGSCSALGRRPRRGPHGLGRLGDRHRERVRRSGLGPGALGGRAHGFVVRARPAGGHSRRGDRALRCAARVPLEHRPHGGAARGPASDDDALLGPESSETDAALSPYGYPGFPVRGASAYMRVSEALHDRRLPSQPNLERAVLVLNDGDDQISDPRARELFRSVLLRDRCRLRGDHASVRAGVEPRLHRPLAIAQARPARRPRGAARLAGNRRARGGPSDRGVPGLGHRRPALPSGRLCPDGCGILFAY